jgi:hypothetical protein
MDKIINAFLALFGVHRIVGWQNIYKSGYYHRAGKPGMYDRHPGDLYPTREAAEADVEPPEFYVATVKVVWYEDSVPHVNGVNSVPVPVVESRRRLKAQPAGYYVDGQWQEPQPRPAQDEVAWAIEQMNSFPW